MSAPLPLVTKGKSILHTYDMQDPNLIGKSFYWDDDIDVQFIEMLIASDEIQLALEVIERIRPGWHRDNRSKELQDIRHRLYQQLYDQFDYSSDHDEANFTREEATGQCLTPYTYPRADILFEDIKKLNDEGHVPWIFEISPSHGWLPVGFADRGLKFNFYGKNMNQPALEKIKAWLPDGVWKKHPVEPFHNQSGDKVILVQQKKILVCFESLEHMQNPHDLTAAAHKLGVEFDRIYLSVPMNTLWGGLPDWRTRRIGHVRTWSPGEFLDFANNSFTGYRWELFKSPSMVLRGSKP